MTTFTYGLELELADVNRARVLPTGCSWNKLERDIVNSDGVAIDPSGHDHLIGGEVNTVPSPDIETQVRLAREAFAALPEATINHRTWLHTHVAIPGLLQDLDTLKKLQRYIQYATVAVRSATLGNLSRPAVMPARSWAWFEERPLPTYQYQYCQRARTVAEFRSGFFVGKKGQYAPSTFRRAAINLYCVFKHGTIEFRIFHGTVSAEEVEGALLFSRDFVNAALAGEGLPAWFKADAYRFPRFVGYNHRLELGWQATKKEKHP